jgi:predicted RNase H-like HicB family nuclease
MKQSIKMDFYTVVLRKSSLYWVALCLENGIVGQGDTRDEAIEKLKEAIESVQDILKTDFDSQSTPISIKELHEFLTVESKEPITNLERFMPKNIPSLKPKQLIKILEKGGCKFYREGKGDHCIYSNSQSHEVQHFFPFLFSL